MLFHSCWQFLESRLLHCYWERDFIKLYKTEFVLHKKHWNTIANDNFWKFPKNLNEKFQFSMNFANVFEVIIILFISDLLSNVNFNELIRLKKVFFFFSFNSFENFRRVKRFRFVLVTIWRGRNRLHCFDS